MNLNDLLCPVCGAKTRRTSNKGAIHYRECDGEETHFFTTEEMVKGVRLRPLNQNELYRFRKALEKLFPGIVFPPLKTE